MVFSISYCYIFITSPWNFHSQRICVIFFPIRFLFCNCHSSHSLFCRSVPYPFHRISNLEVLFSVSNLSSFFSVLKYKFSAEAIRLAETCIGRKPRALAVGSHSGPRAPAMESRLYLSQTEPLNTVIS